MALLSSSVKFRTLWALTQLFQYMGPLLHQHGGWLITQNVAFAGLHAFGLSLVVTLIRTTASFLNLRVSNGHQVGDPGLLA